MPVPGGEFEAEVLLRREVAGIDAEQADQQEDGAHQHVETVKAGRHEEGRAVDVAGEGEGGVAVFIDLHAGEQRAQHDREDQAVFQALAVAFEQRVMRPGHRGARGQQDQRVEQRQVPGVEGLDALRRPDAAEQGFARRVHGIGGEQRCVEIGPEPGDEEHHFGGDEQDHAVAVADLHHAGVVALVLGFADHIGPPAGEGVEHADGADAEHDRGRGIHLVHPAHRADRHDEGEQRADRRPRRGIDEMIVVVLRLRRSHCVSPSAAPVCAGAFSF